MILRPRSSTSGDLALGDLQSTSRPSIISTFSNSRSPAVSPTRALLSLAEADLAAARAKLLELNLPSPPVSFDTLRAIHHELFHDVCTWAGQVRTTQIDKRQYDDHTSRVQMLATPDPIEARADALFRS